jgi:4-aminobutyrate aminotransferase-like enzyme
MFVTAVMGLEALDRGMMLSRVHTAARCMDVVSKVLCTRYKRTDRKRAAKEGRALLDSLEENAAFKKAKRTGERLEIQVIR